MKWHNYGQCKKCNKFHKPANTKGMKGSKHPLWKGGIAITEGYRFIQKPEHPRANSNGYVRENILVMEKHIGRFINDNECVHHINENTLDNSIKNLILLPYRLQVK